MPPPVKSTVINVEGTFQDDAVLSGWFDITNGQISSADMQVSTVLGNFMLDNNAPEEVTMMVGNRNVNVLEGIDLYDNGNFLSLSLLLPPGSVNLDNYTGGALCGSSNNCGAVVSYYLPAKAKDPILSAGFAAAAPEPGSTALLGAGLSAMGLFLRRRFVKK